MSKEIYQEIKRISGEEFREFLSGLDNEFDISISTLICNRFLNKTDN